MNVLSYIFSEARKAVVAFAVAAGGAGFATFREAISDGSISNDEWVTIAGSAVVAGVLAGVAVFYVRNRPA